MVIQNIKSQIQGHESQIANLELAIQHQRLPHALLFTGPESIGKKKVALALAQGLLCETPTQAVACGQCGSCLRVAKLQSENLKMIAPIKQNIVIDQTREVFDFLSLANFGLNRVIIIDQAHLFNPQAANALLKILEEPSDNVFFILIAPEAEAVLPTIRSRSQVIRFSPLNKAQMKVIKPGLQDWIYQCSRGQMNLVAQFSEPEGMEKRRLSFELLEQFWSDPDFLRSDWRDIFKDRDAAVSVVKNWILIMRDVLVLKMNEPGKLLNIDQLSQLQKLSSLENKKINLFISQLLKMESEILRYLDSALLVESVWVNHARK